MYTPTLYEFVSKADEGNLIPVYREFVADTDTPVSAFMKLRQSAGGGENAFLLESVAGGENIGRYSYLGIDPVEVVCTKGRSVTIGENGSSRTRELEEGEDPLDIVRGMLDQYQFVPVEGCDRFYGGAVGYLGYDTVRFFEDIPDDKPDDLGMPDAHFMLTDTLVVFDHVTRKMRVVANAHVTGDPQEAYWAAIKRIDRLVDALQQPLQPSAGNGSVARIPSDPSAMRSTMTKEQHREAVLGAKEYISAGDAIQVVISHRMSAELDVDPFDLYRGVRAINPSPYMYYLSFGENKIIGASPELLVRCEDGHVITRPIAGTRKRGESEKEDLALEEDLLADEKERAEHIMLVDLHRNDLGRVCKPGTVSVDELMKVERYSHVMHIVSNVIGKLREDRDAYDVLRASFPAGTVSGAPKIRAMEIIEELEPVHRGPYAGIVGYFSFSGAMDTCITLRTMVVKDRTVHFQAGGGIVADSDPDAEYNETLMKAGAMLDAARMAEAGLR